MKLSKRTFLLLCAVIALSMAMRVRGGDQFLPPPLDIPDPEMPFPLDPPDPFTDPFDPNSDIPLPDIPDFPPEFPLPPDPPDDLIPLPDPPGLEDPFPDFDPSLFPSPTIGDFEPISGPPVNGGGAPGAELAAARPLAVAVNAVTPLVEFPRRIWFSPHVANAGSGSATPLGCSAPYQNRLMIPESKGSSVAILNTCPVGLLRRVAVGKKPVSVVVTPDGRSALVANSDDGTISVINLASLTVSQTISLPPLNGFPMRPSGIAILPDGSKAYVTDHVDLPGGAVYVIDFTTMKFSTMFDVGGFPASIAVTPDGSQVWVSSWGGGRVDVYDTMTNAVVTGFSVPQANGIAFNPTGTRAYMASGSLGTVIVADTSTYQVVAQIPAGLYPHAVLVTPTGRHVFVTDPLGNSMSLIDAGSNKVLRTIKLKAQHPLGLAFVAKSPF
jgi:YVTN family beta-propeller protein